MSSDSDDSEYRSSDEEINDLDIDEEQTHPFTGEKYTFKSICDNQDYTDLANSIEDCSEPGHSCWKTYQEYVHLYKNDNDLIPQEKTPVRVLSREAWGAVPPKAPPERPSRPSLKLVFYYNVGMKPCYTEEECKRSVKELQRKQMEEDGLSDIGFNFVVGADMNIYEGRGWHTQPDQSLKYPHWRHRKIDVAFLAPRLRRVLHPDHDLMFIVFDFIRVAVMNFYVHANCDLYEIKDHYKVEVPSPPIPITLCDGQEFYDDLLEE